MTLKYLIKLLLLSSLVQLAAAPTVIWAAEASAVITHTLVLMKDSKTAMVDGKTLMLKEAVMIHKGTAYIPLRGIAQAYGYSLSYDPVSKVARVASESLEVLVQAGSNAIKNGTQTTSSFTPFAHNGSLMIPLPVWADLTESRLTLNGIQMILRWTSPNKVSAESPVLPLQISENGRYLVESDGTPFFWLADTAWMLTHRLTRTEIAEYLDNSAAERFNVIQAVALAQLGGLTKPNAHGDLPLIDHDPTKPLVTRDSLPSDARQYDYWDHIDYMVDTASGLGLYVALLPSWGEYLWSNKGQKANVIFNAENAEAYGRWLGERYRDKSNIIWVLGGDRIPDSEDKREIVSRMADGLNAAGARQIKTYHPWGERSSSEWFHNDAWLAFNMFQSGHSSKDFPNDKFAKADYGKSPAKPTVDGEPRYEHSPVNYNLRNGIFDDNDIRQAAYWSVFAGSMGHSYGHHSIWQMYVPGRAPEVDVSTPWREALAAPGRGQMKHLRALMESRPLSSRIPDQSLVADALSGAEHIVATRGADYAMIYTPQGSPFTVNMGIIAGDKINARWFNPRTGESTRVWEFPNTGQQTFTPPSSGQDWVLIVDDAAAGYSAPEHLHL